MQINNFNKVLFIVGKQNHKRLFLIGILLFISGILEALSIGALFPLIELIVNKNEKSQIFDIFLNLFNFKDEYFQNSLNILIYSLIIIFSGKILFQAFTSKFWSKYLYDLQSNISLALLKKYLSMDYSFHVENNSSQLIKNVQIETNNFTQFILAPFFQLLADLFIVSSILTILFILNFKTAFFIIIFFAIAYFILKILTRRSIQKSGAIRFTLEGARLKEIQQGLSGIKEIKLGGLENIFLNNYDNLNKNYTNSLSKFIFLGQLPRLWYEISGVLIILIFLLFLNNTQAQNDFLNFVPLLGIYGMAAFKLLPSVNRITSSIQSLNFNIKLITKIYNDLNLVNNSKYKKNDIEKNISFSHAIEIKNINFSYNYSSELVLDDLNLKIDKGECIGIVGSSGSGKTTLLDILSGLLIPTNGDISVDGISIFENITSFRSIVGYVSQFIYLQDDTLDKNITFSMPNSFNKQKLEEVKKLSLIDEFSEKLPSKGMTIIGENGISLSGGQRQRIGIARALYRDPEILIFDEATSALDTVSEESIIKNVGKLKRRKTMIIITHRKSTLKDCDKIYTLKEGKLYLEK
jgi:ABC-type bacteriocin/lantibiotic exporter with double-glycine peptidase domain